MQISDEGKIGIALGLVGLGGAGALVVLPHPYADYFGWSLIFAAVIGLFALACHHFKVKWPLAIGGGLLIAAAFGGSWFYFSRQIEFVLTDLKYVYSCPKQTTPKITNKEWDKVLKECLRFPFPVYGGCSRANNDILADTWRIQGRNYPIDEKIDAGSRIY